MATKTASFYTHRCFSSVNEERLQRRNQRDISGIAMRALPPPIRTIAANRIGIATVRRRSLSTVDVRASNFAMDGEANLKNNGSEQPPLNEEKKKLVEEKESAKVKLPPPPEKPLPGDCCGNGCIPCVWDTYYEELEDYNKLIAKSKS